MEAIEQFASVGAVLALLVGTLWWLRRRGFAVPALAVRGTASGGRRVRRLECVERVALGPQQTLHLVRLGDRALLVTSSPAGCTLLQSVAWGEIGPSEKAAQ